jgi:hypothetical protein
LNTSKTDVDTYLTFGPDLDVRMMAIVNFKTGYVKVRAPLIFFFKIMLKAKIVQILFLQIHQNFAKYIFETFTVDGITIAYQIESIA